MNNPTLRRFYSIHFITPIIILLVASTHILFLHESGSSNPIGLPKNIDKLPFHPFFVLKDILGLFVILIILSYLYLITPYKLNDPENFIAANPLTTPIHIQPEWYFLFAYAILRSIPNKLGGVLVLCLSVTAPAVLTLTKNKHFKRLSMSPHLKLYY